MFEKKIAKRKMEGEILNEIPITEWGLKTLENTWKG